VTWRTSGTAKAEHRFAPQLFRNLAASKQAADGGVRLMGRSARNYELAIAALGGALAMVTFLFLWERSAIEAVAKETPADWSGGTRMFAPLWPYHQALGLLPPDQQDLNDDVGPAESDSPYDVISPYLHNVPAKSPAAPSAAPRPTKTASLRPDARKPSTPSTPATASDFWLPDVGSLLIPASLGMLVIPLAELDRTQYSQVTVWSPAPAPSGDPPGIGGPFHLFFTTDSPTGVAPVAESGGGGGLTSSTTSTVTNAVSSATTSVTDLASSTTSATTALISSTTSTATGLVSSVLRRH
jgi:hypothetical protein